MGSVKQLFSIFLVKKISNSYIRLDQANYVTDQCQVNYEEEWSQKPGKVTWIFSSWKQIPPFSQWHQCVIVPICLEFLIAWIT